VGFQSTSATSTEAIPAGREAARTRVVGLSRGNPHSPHDGSGVPLHLFNALARRYALIERVDTRLPQWQRGLVALATFRPSRVLWTERYFKNVLAFKLLSRNSGRKLGAIDRPYDVALQFNGLFRTRGAPYTVYLDVTYEQSAQAWPEWNPLGGRRLAHWYDLERELYRDALHIFTMSSYAARSLTSFYGIAPERVTVVGGGVNIAVLETGPRASAGQPPTILFVGKEFQRKGGDCLLAAFRRVRAALPAARLQIVGTTEVAAEPGVEVLGRIADRDRLARCYAEAAVFCLPSRFDPFPGVLIEAMAHGLPCVGTTVCGIPEIILDGETGLLVPPDNSAALAAALLRLLTDSAYAERLGAAGRRRTAAELSWDRVVERMAPVLDPLRGMSERQHATASHEKPRGDPACVGDMPIRLPRRAVWGSR